MVVVNKLKTMDPTDLSKILYLLNQGAYIFITKKTKKKKNLTIELFFLEEKTKLSLIKISYKYIIKLW